MMEWEYVRWWCQLRNYIGSEFTHASESVKNLTQLILRNCQLNVILSLQYFPMLELLDLSGNPLRVMPGLELLHKYTVKSFYF
jgi:Leucine-rich repeat (LRR) protein